MQITDNEYCFICGNQNPIGFKVKPQVNVSEQSAWFQVHVPIEFQGWEGVVHGGIVSALLDEAAAHAALVIAPQVVTAELKVRYLKPVPVSEALIVKARVTSQVRRSIFVETTITLSGQLLARGEARMAIIRSDPRTIHT